MRLYGVTGIFLVCGLVAGCQSGKTSVVSDTKLDVALVKTLNNIGVENAIITQHTLYPYHFASEAESLNELGARDLAVLARHFMKHPGVLNIRRDQASDGLYEARVAYVVRSLKEAGVNVDDVRVADGMPGGSGNPSERVVMILGRSSREPATIGLTDSGMVAQ